MKAAKDSTLLYHADGKGLQEVTNLGWLLRHSDDVRRIEVRPLWAADDVTRPSSWDCVMEAHLRDGRVYVTPWADKTICLDWLDRPKFQSLPLLWFGYEGVCGGEKYRSSLFDYEWSKQ